jgi:hypothetical protein
LILLNPYLWCNVKHAVSSEKFVYMDNSKRKIGGGWAYASSVKIHVDLPVKCFKGIKFIRFERNFCDFWQKPKYCGARRLRWSTQTTRPTFRASDNSDLLQHAKCVSISLQCDLQTRVHKLIMSGL